MLRDLHFMPRSIPSYIYLSIGKICTSPSVFTCKYYTGKVRFYYFFLKSAILNNSICLKNRSRCFWLVHCIVHTIIFQPCLTTNTWAIWPSLLWSKWNNDDICDLKFHLSYATRIFWKFLHAIWAYGTRSQLYHDSLERSMHSDSHWIGFGLP